MNTVKPVGLFVAQIKAANGSESDLDDLVHDVASSLASNANNGGIDGQVAFLVANGVSEAEILAALGIESLTCKLCDKVMIYDPEVLREHLEGHHSNTANFSAEQVRDFFKES